MEVKRRAGGPRRGSTTAQPRTTAQQQQQQQQQPPARGGSAVRKTSPWVGRWDEPKAHRVASCPCVAGMPSQQAAASHDYIISAERLLALISARGEAPNLWSCLVRGRGARCARARVERRAARTFSIQTAVCLRRSHSFVPLLSCYLNSDFGLLIITDAHM